MSNNLLKKLEEKIQLLQATIEQAMSEQRSQRNR